MSILKDIFESVFNRGKELQAAQTVKPPQEIQFLSNPHQIAYVHGGGVEFIGRQRDARSHQVERIEDLVTAVQKWGGDSCVCVGPNKIEAIFDDGHLGINHAVMYLRPMQAFARVEELLGGKEFSQVDLVRLLRNDLRGASPALLSAVRNIKFSRSENGVSNLQHGNESLGRSIEAAVTGADKIDESFIVATPLYAIKDLLVFHFLVTVEVNTQKQTFTLRAQRDEVDDARQATLEQIVGMFEGGLDGATIVIGTYRVAE